MSRTVSDPDRLQGRYYTPAELVEAMLRLALDPLLESRNPTESPPLRILDPACGEGAFLIAAFDRLKNWCKAAGRGASGIIDRYLFGVDIDQDALTRLRIRLAGVSLADPCRSSNFCWGDALTGAGFGEAEGSSPDEATWDAVAPSIDWPAAFPQAAGAGGFDLVMGNPPYRRELASKAILDRLKKSPLGRKWHQPRLDLWGYFLHRGLDLLRDGGRLAFVLPSYWTASTGARQLIACLEEQTTICDVVRLGRLRVFPHVEGRHLILSLQKGRRSDPCRVWDLSDGADPPAKLLAAVAHSSNGLQQKDGVRVFCLEQAELFQGGQLCLSRPEHVICRMDRQSHSPLRAKFEVRQGIVENPRRITRATAKASAQNYRAGEGVFVLMQEELSRLELNPAERELLRPYYRGTDIERYWLAESPAEFLLYLTRRTAETLEPFPNVEKHLARFRPLLEERREVRRGRIAWWHLHWPRDERLFLAPRLLMPQMGRVPRFVCCEAPAFVGFAMHVIGLGDQTKSDSPSLPLLALTGVLNSGLAAGWFRSFAKQRGAALDISGTLLRRFPLPPENPEAERVVAQLVADRQRLPPGSPQIDALEAEIETLVRKCYELVIPVEK